jgi:large subunit ribosomal protein L25
MEEIVLQAKPRKVIGKQVKALRREGVLPAVIYGRGIEPFPIELNYHAAISILPGVSSSQLIVVSVDDRPHTSLVRERQHDPVTGALLHVDFQEVSMTEKLRTTVSIELVGEAPVVKNFNGVIVTGQEELEIECLPKDLPERITIDLSVLEKIGDVIHVRDLFLSAQIEILTDLNEMVVLVTAPALEPEPEVAEQVAGPEEPEVVERGKKEEENF